MKTGDTTSGRVTCLPEPLKAQNVLHLQHTTRVLLNVRFSIWRAFIFTPCCHEGQCLPVLNLLCCLKWQEDNYNTSRWTVYICFIKALVRKWFKRFENEHFPLLSIAIFKKSSTYFYLWYIGYYFIGYTTGIKYIFQWHSPLQTLGETLVEKENWIKWSENMLFSFVQIVKALPITVFDTSTMLKIEQQQQKRNTKKQEKIISVSTPEEQWCPAIIWAEYRICSLSGFLLWLFLSPICCLSSDHARVESVYPGIIRRKLDRISFVDSASETRPGEAFGQGFIWGLHFVLLLSLIL